MCQAGSDVSVELATAHDLILAGYAARPIIPDKRRSRKLVGLVTESRIRSADARGKRHLVVC
jgi:hypothetical protein